MKYLNLALILIFSSYRIYAQELEEYEDIDVFSLDEFVNIPYEENLKSVDYIDDKIFVSYLSFNNSYLNIYRYDDKMEFIDTKKIYKKEINHSFSQIVNLNNELYIIGKRFGEDNVLRYYATHIDKDNKEINTQEISNCKMLGKQNRKKYLFRTSITKDEDHLYIITYSFIKGQEVLFNIDVFDSNLELEHIYKDVEYGIRCTNKEFMIGINIPSELKYFNENNTLYGVYKMPDESRQVKKSRDEYTEMNYSLFRINDLGKSKLDITIPEQNIKNASYVILENGNISVVGIAKKSRVVSGYNILIDKDKFMVIDSAVFEINQEELAFTPIAHKKKSYNSFAAEQIQQCIYLNSNIGVSENGKYYMMFEQFYSYSVGESGSIMEHRGKVMLMCIDKLGEIEDVFILNRHYNTRQNYYAYRQMSCNYRIADNGKIQVMINSMKKFHFYEFKNDDDEVIEYTIKIEEEERCQRYVFKENSKLDNDVFLIFGVAKPQPLPEGSKKVVIVKRDYSSNIYNILLNFK